jgi:hypothetical protein
MLFAQQHVVAVQSVCVCVCVYVCVCVCKGVIITRVGVCELVLPFPRAACTCIDHRLATKDMIRIGQNHTYTSYMIVYLMKSMPKIPYRYTPYVPVYGSGQP